MVTPVTEWVKDKPVHRGAANIWNFLKTKATRYILNKNIARAKCILQLQLINYLNRGSYSRWSLRTCCPLIKVIRPFRRKKSICGCSRSKQMPYTGQITYIAPYRNISELPSNINTITPTGNIHPWCRYIGQSLLCPSQFVPRILSKKVFAVEHCYGSNFKA